ncbi:hypothetical protein [Solimicrobium silvestre]|uniref:Uncharacterized protein n=1 Tax=Solimicrobium silvestre TaxID=2099400 RepID=A0A2S9GY66_9BURK|nr:hypothetical protein [Solimicrobium silvestre]PRC92640.1 hypothetical protein S2091_2695 [Solimicrobium silvestre]
MTDEIKPLTTEVAHLTPPEMRLIKLFREATAGGKSLITTMAEEAPKESTAANDES